MKEDPRIKEARRLLWEVTDEQRKAEKFARSRDKCECGHQRKFHSVSHSINYTEGMCKRCECKNYLYKRS